MELVDMKLPKKTEKELKTECMPCKAGDQDRWPYGLQLRFEKEQMDKMPALKTYKVGDKVMVTAEATITGVRISERQGGKEDHSVELQIEKIACEPKVKKPLEQMNPKEYRKAREEK
ncbi:MAG: capsid staple protein [Clostridia bacterium]